MATELSANAISSSDSAWAAASTVTNGIIGTA